MEFPLFAGLRIVQSDLVPAVEPRIQLSPNFKWCTPEFRAETNAWFLEQFGTREVAYLWQGGVFINPTNAVKLVNHLKG